MRLLHGIDPVLRHAVFFFIERGRRRLIHFNVTAHPNAEWVWRQLIEATPWRRQLRFLIRDRDACFGRQFITRARALGIEVVLTPFRCPRANGIAERMVGTFRQQCLDHLIVLNERHLLRLVREYAEHYNRVRPHRSLDLEAPEPRPRLPKPPDGGRVGGRRVLGGLHHEYYWEAVRWISGASQSTWTRLLGSSAMRSTARHFSETLRRMRKYRDGTNLGQLLEAGELQGGLGIGGQFS